MANKKATHIITYKMEGGYWHQQYAYGKTDLFNAIKDLMKSGYTEFGIEPFKVI